MPDSGKINVPPVNIDGAQVMEYAWSNVPFGYVSDTNGKMVDEIYGLAICRYADSNVIYRFSCDKNWEVSQDADYNSIQDAKDLLPQQYKNTLITWRKYDAAQQADAPEPLTRPGDP